MLGQFRIGARLVWWCLYGGVRCSTGTSVRWHLYGELLYGDLHCMGTFVRCRLYGELLYGGLYCMGIFVWWCLDGEICLVMFGHRDTPFAVFAVKAGATPSSLTRTPLMSKTKAKLYPFWLPRPSEEGRCAH
jgi:hypothetical protein